MTLLAGVAKTDISPQASMFLCGYPHVDRMSTSVNDPLYASSLVVQDQGQTVVFVSLDILFLDPQTAVDIRQTIAERLKTAEQMVFVSCTHTHSGPVTCEMLAFQSDPLVPRVEPAYIDFVKKQIYKSVDQAQSRLRKAQLAWTSATIDGVGGNRLDPNGPRDPEAGIVAVRDAESGKIFGLTLTYCMHPTVMHEDSTLVSADFPGYCRLRLQERLSDELVVVYQTGPEGNQSPRYDVNGQTFAEAERLGNRLADRVADAVFELGDEAYQDQVVLKGVIKQISLDRRQLPTLAEAEKNLSFCRDEYQRLKAERAGHGPVRTAECAVFGAEETYFLAQCQVDGRLDSFMTAYEQFDIQVIRLGDLYMVGWPGEIFIEFDLELKQRSTEKVFITCLVNGELQGYIVTEGAAKAGGYEATNAMFTPDTGKLLIDTSLELIKQLN